MAALSLTLALFVTWTAIGWALVSVLNGGRNLMRSALLAPVAGASVVTLAIFECNRWGMPVRACGPAVAMLSVLIAAAAIWRFRLPVPWSRLAPFLAIVAGSAVLVGYPLLLHGFDWFSYGNDDMANYVLGAAAFLKHGYLDSLDPRPILEGRDPGMAALLPMILTGARCGCELMLACVMSVTGLSGHQVFMPVIVALHLVLICATGALMMRGRHHRLTALLTCAWLAVSSLVALATVYQLIAQVFGLAMLAAAASVMLEPIRWEPRRAALKRAALAAVFCAAMGVTYPEILPFLVLPFGITHALALCRRRETGASLIRFAAVTLGGTMVLLNTYTVSVPAFLLHQAGMGLRTTSVSDVLFPYYLLPSGLATFWGFLPIAQPMGPGWLDIAIAAGAILLVVAVLAIVRKAWQGQPAAAIALAMLILAIRLGWARSDFGLYKLAMYIQPFLLGSVVSDWLGWRQRVTPDRKWPIAARVCPIAIVAVLGLPAQVRYVSLSAGLAGASSGFVEVPEASTRHLISRLQILSREPHRSLIVSDTSNVVLAKVEAADFTPSRQEYPAQDYFTSSAWAGMRLASWYPELVRPGYVARAQRTLVQWHALQDTINFDMHGEPPNVFVRVAGRDGAADRYSLLASGPLLSVINRRQTRDALSGSMVTALDSEQVRNYLIQVDSELGRNYFHAFSARGEGRVSMFQLEPDYFYPGRSMSAVGRVILFEILHPSPRVRLEMEYTASLKSDGRNAIPPIQAIGAQRSLFGAVGRGSARLFSHPLETQTIAGRHYIAVDMGAAGQLFPQSRSGLMRWFGTSIPLDSRRVTGFVRDVSALDAAQYDNLDAPVRVADFPADLARKGLEYSGIYEDAWVAEESFLWLRQPAQQALLVVRVMVPGLAQKATTLRVLADGRLLTTAILRHGDNEVQAIVPGPAARRRIDLRFDNVVALPAPDGRTVSAQIKFAGFSESAVGRAEIAEPPIAIVDHWYPFEKFGGQTFRWVENDAGFTVTAPAKQPGELAIDFEPGPGMGGKPLVLRLLLADGRSHTLPTVTGRQLVRLPLTLAPGVSHISLRCEGGGLSIPTDPRILNFRVFTLTWTPRS